MLTYARSGAWAPLTAVPVFGNSADAVGTGQYLYFSVKQVPVFRRLIFLNGSLFVLVKKVTVYIVLILWVLGQRRLLTPALTYADVC